MYMWHKGDPCALPCPALPYTALYISSFLDNQHIQGNVAAGATQLSKIYAPVPQPAVIPPSGTLNHPVCTKQTLQVPIRASVSVQA